MLDPFRLRMPAQEMMLVDAIRRLEKRRAERIAVIIHLSRLTSANRRHHCLRIATDLFITCISAFEGQFFALENNDIVFIARNVPFESIDQAVNRLRVLFSEDPLAQFMEDSEDQPHFCTWFNLEQDYAVFLETALNLLHEAEKARENSGGKARQLRPEDHDAIRPESLARIEQALENADVSGLVRRQTVCLLAEGQEPEPLFEELYVSIADLQKEITPGIDLSSNRWLFQYLTQTLDRRVMNALTRDGPGWLRPFSLNLNVVTVLSPEFARFEATITPQLRGRLVIEMNKIDVFSDMGAFLFARDYLHDRGFRLCLDGLTHNTLPYYDRARLGFDLIKIFWTPDSIDDMRSGSLPAIRSIVMEAGQARTILCRCDNERAIEIGQSLGIVMFQGRHVDRLLANPET